MLKLQNEDAYIKTKIIILTLGGATSGGDDPIVVVDIDKDAFETDLIPGQPSSADIVQVGFTQLPKLLAIRQFEKP